MYHGDAKVWSNMLENRRDISALARNNQVYRLLKPRHLCFLNDPSSPETLGVDVREVAGWELEHGEDTPLRYLFVAYSTELVSLQTTKREEMGRHSKGVTGTGLRTGFGDTGVTCVVTALDSCETDSISGLQTHAPENPYECPLCWTTWSRVLRRWALL